MPPNSNHIRRYFKNLPKALHPPSLHNMVLRAIFPTFNNKPLPPTEDQLRNIFKKYDTNNDNMLSREELKKAFDYLGSLIPGFRADRGLHHADANKDGYVNEREMDDLVKYAVQVGFTVR